MCMNKCDEVRKRSLQFDERVLSFYTWWEYLRWGHFQNRTHLIGCITRRAIDRIKYQMSNGNVLAAVFFLLRTPVAGAIFKQVPNLVWFWGAIMRWLWTTAAPTNLKIFTIYCSHAAKRQTGDYAIKDNEKLSASWNLKCSRCYI